MRRSLAGAILKTEDGGSTWGALSSGTTNTLYDVEFVSADRGWVVGYPGIVMATRSGGE